MNETKCIFCNLYANQNGPFNYNNMFVYKYTCNRCGDYIILMSVNDFCEYAFREVTEKQRYIMSNNIYHYFQAQRLISKNDINNLILEVDKNPLVKINSLLINLIKKSDNIGDNNFKPNDMLTLSAESWLCGEIEFINTIKILQKQGYLDAKFYTDNSLGKYEITYEGYKHASLLSKNPSSIKNAFIAMSFNTD